MGGRRTRDQHDPADPRRPCDRGVVRWRRHGRHAAGPEPERPGYDGRPLAPDLGRLERVVPGSRRRRGRRTHRVPAGGHGGRGRRRPADGLAGRHARRVPLAVATVDGRRRRPGRSRGRSTTGALDAGSPRAPAAPVLVPAPTKVDQGEGQREDRHDQVDADGSKRGDDGEGDGGDIQGDQDPSLADLRVQGLVGDAVHDERPFAGDVEHQQAQRE